MAELVLSGFARRDVELSYRAPEALVDADDFTFEKLGGVCFSAAGARGPRDGELCCNKSGGVIGDRGHTVFLCADPDPVRMTEAARASSSDCSGLA